MRAADVLAALPEGRTLEGPKLGEALRKARIAAIGRARTLRRDP